MLSPVRRKMGGGKAEEEGGDKGKKRNSLSQRYVAPKHGARAYNYVTLHRMLDLWAVGTSDGGQGP